MCPPPNPRVSRFIWIAPKDNSNYWSSYYLWFQLFEDQTIEKISKLQGKQTFSIIWKLIDSFYIGWFKISRICNHCEKASSCMSLARWQNNKIKECTMICLVHWYVNFHNKLLQMLVITNLTTTWSSQASYLIK